MFSRLSVAQVASCILLASGCIAASVLPRADVCNGYSELCSKSYGAVSYVGTHDSFAVGVNNLGANQDQNITQQLNDGVRMLQVQAHNEAGTIKLCHTTCTIYDGGSLQDYLSTVNNWLTSNPNEVVTLLIVNIDNVAVSEYATVFEAASVDTLSYSPTSSTLTAGSWPTLGELIDSGKRLVTFIDNQADFATVPYIIDEFTNIWETAFGVTDTFDCEVNRTKGDTSTQMYMINHFLDKLVFGQTAPNVDMANVTNAASGAGSLGEQVDLCTTQWSRAPNFLLVDFYEYGGGSVFEVAASINSVTYNPTTPVASPVSTASSSESSTATTSRENSGLSLVGRSQWPTCFAMLAGAFLGACIVL